MVLPVVDQMGGPPPWWLFPLNGSQAIPNWIVLIPVYPRHFVGVEVA